MKAIVTPLDESGCSATAESGVLGITGMKVPMERLSLPAMLTSHIDIDIQFCHPKWKMKSIVKTVEIVSVL